MKIYTIHSESHNEFHENFFIPTLPTDLELHSYLIPQECKTANFKEKGWEQTCHRKTEVFLRACDENTNDIFIFSDVDIQFFDKNIVNILLEELSDYDLACQYDTGYLPYCSGFFVCRVNDRTKDLFNRINKLYVEEDQTSLNYHISACRAKFFSNRFYTVAQTIGTKWDGQHFVIPKDILMHHANWVVGVKNKIFLLKLVREKYELLPKISR